ncbi:MAG: hypothetical protein KF777_21670 [Planctomycetaceae bacterium]|jgi:hypothetical protein|nr:hypothetical protein [Planctomycetaceae bacterium]
MAIAVFALSAVTAILCSSLLIRGYRRNRVRLLLWSGVCFAALALENLVLIVNEYTTVDLNAFRLLVPLIGLMALLYGLLWEIDSH